MACFDFISGGVVGSFVGVYRSEQMRPTYDQRGKRLSFRPSSPRRRQKLLGDGQGEVLCVEEGAGGASIRRARIQDQKEQEFSKRVGYDQMGDGEDDVAEEDEEYRGPRNTTDWIRRQAVEVEGMSAYPLGRNRNPVPKRVDVDITVKETKGRRIISWIDPEDKVAF